MNFDADTQPIANAYAVALLATLAAVEKGAALLRRFYGHDWYSLVDTSTLSMNSVHACVLSQVHSKSKGSADDAFGNSYRDGLKVLFGEFTPYADVETLSDEHGFSVASYSGRTYDETDAEWARLDMLWKGYIETAQRRDRVFI